jgi:hypothetical protein
VIAGNAHTALTPTMLGVPLGARLAEWRPGVREIHIRYGNGTCYHLSPHQFKRQFSIRRTARLRAEGSALVLDLPAPVQAWVPHRMAADEPPAKPSPPGYTGAFPAYLDQPALPPPQPPSQSGYPDFPQRAAPPGAPRAPAAPPRPRGTPAPPDPWSGRRNPYQTRLTTR